MLFSSAMVCVMAHLPGSLSCCGDFLFLAKHKHINTLLFFFVWVLWEDLGVCTYRHRGVKNRKYITVTVS